MSNLFIISLICYILCQCYSLKNFLGCKPSKTFKMSSKLYSTMMEPELNVRKDAKEKQFDWNKQWYPIAVEEYVDSSKAHNIMFLGNNCVLWNSNGTWSFLDDKCPHRGVPLSEGRVESNGELLCSYHAWTFDKEGQCTSIPQTESKLKEDTIKTSTKACVKQYPLRIEQGLIWAWGESGHINSDVFLEAAIKQPRLIEELTDHEYAGRILPVTYNYRDLPYGWDMFLENVLDPAHVVVSHHGIVGNRYNDPAHLKVTKVLSRSEIPVKEGGELIEGHEEDAGFKHIIEMPSRKESILGEKGNVDSNDFRPPCLQKITTEYPSGAKLILALYATPTKPGYCRHIGAQVLIKDKEGKVPKGLGMFALPMPKWLLHSTASLFLHQDQVFLHHQERTLYEDGYAFGDFSNDPILASKVSSDPAIYAKSYYMPNEHDKQITALRRWIHNKAGGGVPWGKAALIQGLPKRLNDDDLYDVHEAHTSTCSICTTARKNMLRLRNLAALTAGMGFVLIQNKAMKIATTIFASLASVIIHKLQKMLVTFKTSHQDNN